MDKAAEDRHLFMSAAQPSTIELKDPEYVDAPIYYSSSPSSMQAPYRAACFGIVLDRVMLTAVDQQYLQRRLPLQRRCWHHRRPERRCRALPQEEPGDGGGACRAHEGRKGGISL